MKFNIIVSPESDPNASGEFLRNEFFKEEYSTVYGKKYRKTGCYEIFELSKNTVELPEEVFDPEYPEEGFYTVAKKTINGQDIIMKYYWDGDGELEFHFEDGSLLYNTDCKKDYVWEYYGCNEGDNLCNQQ